MLDILFLKTVFYKYKLTNNKINFCFIVNITIKMLSFFINFTIVSFKLETEIFGQILSIFGFQLALFAFPDCIFF